MSHSRLFLLILLVALIVFTGLASRDGGIILLATPLIAYLGAAVWLAPQHIDLQARRAYRYANKSGIHIPPHLDGRLEHAIPAGSRVIVQVAVANAGQELSEALVADGGWGHASGLPAGARLVWSYAFHPKRGLYRFQDILVSASDPFGLFSRRFEIPAETNGQPGLKLLVLPEMVSLQRIALRPPVLRGFAGPVTARAPGSGTDFYGVRQYQPGDSPRHLNWRVTSKHERELFTNQYEGERYADVGLILDARFARNLYFGEHSLFESAVLASASLGRALLRDGHRVSLLVYGFSSTRLMPNTGRVQIDRILRMLAAAYPVHNYALESLQYLPTRVFPPRSQIIFVSPLTDDDFDPLVRFRAQGYEVLVVSPDPVDFERRYSPPGEADYARSARTTALRLARIERTLLLRNLQRHGVWVVNWAAGSSLAYALQSGLASKQRGRLAGGR